MTNVDRQSALRDHGRRFGVERIAGVVETLRNAADRLKHNANVRLTLNVLMLDLPRP